MFSPSSGTEFNLVWFRLVLSDMWFRLVLSDNVITDKMHVETERWQKAVGQTDIIYKGLV